MHKLTLHSMLLFAQGVAMEAGEKLLEYFRKPSLKVNTKLNESDIVTEADRASEEIIIGAIRREYPEHAILSEESGCTGTLDSPWKWVIDPLDGTTNFSEGLPGWAVSIGIEHDGRKVGGVVYAPYLREIFIGEVGHGATLNWKPIKCRNNSHLNRAVISTGFPVDKDTNPANNLDNLTEVLPKVRGIRRLGSASIDLCYVAAGYLDGYWEMNLHEWDVSAALCILGEAGGEYGYFRDDRNVSVCCASPEIFPQLFPLLK